MTRPYLCTTWGRRRRTWAELTAPLGPDEYAAAMADSSIEDALEQGRLEAEREYDAMHRWLALAHRLYY